MYSLLKPLLFTLVPEAAHGLALGSLRLGEPILPFLSPWLKLSDPRLEKTVFGLKFPNPAGLPPGSIKKPRWFRSGKK